jgi:putative acetyltransferase
VSFVPVVSFVPSIIRTEEPRDVDQIRVVNERAFGRPDEAALVDALRGPSGTISLVAESGDRIVGHILFSFVRIDGAATTLVTSGLAPMAVLPECQRQGIGSQLVRAGIDACRSAGHDAVVVVGHPDFYPRFGFVPADTKGLRYEHEVPREAFMVLELRPAALADTRGVVRYRPEFAGH